MFFSKKKNEPVEDEYPINRIVKKETVGPDGVVVDTIFVFQVLRIDKVELTKTIFYYKNLYECRDLDTVRDYKKKWDYEYNSKTSTTVIE